VFRLFDKGRSVAWLTRGQLPESSPIRVPRQLLS
jgi:hypothetical protein